MLKFLSAELSISRSFFLIPRFAGTLVGCWPVATRSWLKVGIFWTNCFLVTLGACGENLYGFVYIKELLHALEAFCPGITKAICTLKMLSLFIYRREWLKTISRMRKMLTESKLATLKDDVNEQKSKIVQEHASIASKFCFLVCSSGSTTNAFFNISPLITGAYGVLKGKPYHFQLPFNIILPKVLTSMPFYPYTYLALTMSGVMTVFTFSTVDGFFVCACMYTSAMFRMLQYDIRQLFDELKTTEKATGMQNSKIRARLGDLVVRHNAIIDLCTDFIEQFTVIILMHFLSAAIVLCLSILNLMLNFGSISMFIYLFYSIAALTQLFLYCIGGNYVSESSLEVAATLYDIEWYKCDVRTRKMILMMLRRAQKAKTTAVPFFTPSLSAFSSIISTAGSYITLLQTFL